MVGLCVDFHASGCKRITLCASINREARQVITPRHRKSADVRNRHVIPTYDSVIV